MYGIMDNLEALILAGLDDDLPFVEIVNLVRSECQWSLRECAIISTRYMAKVELKEQYKNKIAFTSNLYLQFK